MLFEFCIPLHSVRQAQQDLFASKLPQPRVRTPSLPPAYGGPSVGTPQARAPARSRTPPARGPPAQGPACRRGPPAEGPLAYGASWECEMKPGLSVPSLRSLLPCPAPQAPRSTVRRLNSVPRQPSGRLMPTISLPQSWHNGPPPPQILLEKICQSYDIHIHSPRNNKRSSMPAQSIGVPFCKRERNPCAWDSACRGLGPNLGAACARGRRRADLMSRKGAMDFVPSTF